MDLVNIKAAQAAAELEAEELLNRPTNKKARKGLMSDEPYAKELLALYEGKQSVSVEIGDVINGCVTHATFSDIWADAGLKHSVRIPRNQAEDDMVQGVLSYGESTRILITAVDKDDIRGSLVGAINADRVSDILHLADKGTPIEAIITESSNGHFTLEASILPGIKLTMQHSQSDLNKVQDVNSLVGTSMSVMVDGHSPDKSIFYVSRKKYLESLAPAAIKKLKLNTLYTGKITGVTDFGVFVQFNECLNGMIHIANINPEYVDVIKIVPHGTEIEFYVKEILKHKVMLTQVPRESVWDTVRVGQDIKGTIFAIKEFGIMVKFDEETKGLVHSSEVPENFAGKEGQEISVKVLSVSRSDRKIYLTLS